LFSFFEFESGGKDSQARFRRQENADIVYQIVSESLLKKAFF
jgi:hypothetical protein